MCQYQAFFFSAVSARLRCVWYEYKCPPQKKVSMRRDQAVCAFTASASMWYEAKTKAPKQRGFDVS